MIDDIIKIELNGSTYNARLDMGSLAEVQYFFNKVKPNRPKDEFVSVSNIFDGIFNGNLSIIDELLIQSILRIHKQLDREKILENMKLSEKRDIEKYVTKLISISLPQDDKKKQVIDQKD